ncbi:MAG: shikimate kinase [Dehalococcoidia bacterium]
MSAARRVVIYGPSGSGKSTLGREVAAALGVSLIELDAIFHSRPDWNDIPVEEFRERLGQALDEAAGGWVADGNYHSMVGDVLLPRAELAVWLRLPFRVVYPRLVRRTLRRMATREVLWGVNHESFRKGFLSRESILLWGITNWRQHRTSTRAQLRAAKAAGVRVVVLRQRDDVERWRHEMLATAPGAAKVE